MSGLPITPDIVQTSFFDSEETDNRLLAPDVDRTSELGQYFTPRWVPELLMPLLGPLTDKDHVIDPHCGRGSWLFAVPDDVPASGIEIDEKVAAIARADTGRNIIVGDFGHIEIDFDPTVAVGNPPFSSDAIETTLTRLRDIMLPKSRAGFLVPVHSFSFGARTIDLLRGFDVATDLIPRDLYPRISFALMFLRLERSTTQRMQGFLLYREAVAIRSLRLQYRRVLESGRRPLWREVVEMALRACGGEASLSRIYEIVENFRPTSNRFWRDAIRREAAEHFDRVEPGVFRLRAAA
jgi:site-specific DNA-methyltransferase (adenine-specific)